MQIDLDLYRVFVSVAQNGSVSKAAQELFVTQSAISQRIAKLEDLFGRQLFVRSKRGLSLTNFGQELLDECAQSVATLEKVFEQVSTQSQKRDLKICASELISKSIIIPAISKHFKDKQITIDSLLSDKEKILAVENGKADFAIINDYNLPLSGTLYKKVIQRLDYGFFYNDKLLDITKENVFDQTLLIKNARTKGRIEFNKKFYKEACRFSKTMEFSHDELIVEATRIGLGIGFCPRQYAAGLKEIELSREVLSKKIILIYQQKSELVEDFLRYLSIC